MRNKSLTVQADGKIVAVGSVNDGSASDFYLARFNANGTVDTGFDGDGKLITDFGGTFDAAYDVRVQPDGKIIAVGLNSQRTTLIGLGSRGAVLYRVADDNSNTPAAVCLEGEFPGIRGLDRPGSLMVALMIE
jgi:uncharacterized delta-60 repeat protein